jgi:hypothetical protein
MLLKTTLFIAFSVFLLSNILNLGVRTAVQYAHAAIVTLNPQSSSVANQNFVLAQSATTNTITCDTTQNGILTITKLVSDPNNIVGSSINNLLFGIQFTDNGLSNTISLGPPPASKSFCIQSGHAIVVTEPITTVQGFTFSPAFSGGCNTTINSGQTANCTITNTVQTGGATTIPFGATVSKPTTGVTTTQLVSPQAATIAPTPLNNPPFQTCEGNQVTTSGQNVVNVNGLNVPTGSSTATRAPSSATYTIQGAIPLDSVREAMNSLGQQHTFTIELLQDLQTSDGLMLAIANPQLSGKVIVESPNGIKQKIIDFNVQTVRTECKFITLAKAAGPAPNANVAPLGQLGQSKSIHAPDINKLLIGGLSVSSTPTPGGQSSFPPVLNPPWATCITTNVTPQAGAVLAVGNDNVALYNVRGDISSLSQISGNTLVIEINSDLQPTDTDLAKITDNNNPYMKVNLIADPGRNTVHQIDFTLDDMWTDCKQISTNDKNIFQPIIGEINP